MSSGMRALEIAGAEAEAGGPAPGRLISGDPKFRTWNVEEQPGGLYAGVWESTPGKWRVSYDEWEYCRILSGVSIVTEDGGAARRADRVVRPVHRAERRVGAALVHRAVHVGVPVEIRENPVVESGVQPCLRRNRHRAHCNQRADLG